MMPAYASCDLFGGVASPPRRNYISSTFERNPGAGRLIDMPHRMPMNERYDNATRAVGDALRRAYPLSDELPADLQQLLLRLDEAQERTKPAR